MDLLCLGGDAHKIRPVTQPYILHKHQPQTCLPTPHPSQASTTNQSPTPTSITIINPKPIGNPTSITSINYKPITQPHIHHKHQPQTNHPSPHPSQVSPPKPITASISAPTKRIRISLVCLIFLANAIRQISDIRISISIGLGAIGKPVCYTRGSVSGRSAVAEIVALSYSTAMTNPPPGARCTLSLPSSGMVIWQRL